MFDVSTTEITREIAWVSILMYSIALIYTLATYRKWTGTSNSWFRNLFWLLFLGVFSVTYAIDSDFFHYKEIVYSTREIQDYGLELVYQYIILFLDNNYLLFRIVVFGGATFVYYLILSKLVEERIAGILLMLIVFGGIFSYARATLAFAIYYLGLAFIVSSNDKKGVIYSFIGKSVTTIIGLGLIISSYFFHRSMLILMALTPFVVLKLGRKSIYIITLLSPLIFIAIQAIIGDVFLILAFDDVIEKRIYDTYAEAIQSNANWLGIIGNILHYGKYLLCFVLISISIFRNRVYIDTKILQLYSFYMALSYVSILFYPLFEGNIIYMHRCLNMTIVPIIVIIIYLYKNRYMPFNHLKWVVYWSVVNSFLGFARYIF